MPSSAATCANGCPLPSSSETALAFELVRKCSSVYVRHQAPRSLRSLSEVSTQPGEGQPAWQGIRRGEPNPLASPGRAAVLHLHPLHPDRSDPRLDRPCRAMAMPDKSCPDHPRAAGRPSIGQEGRSLALDRLGQQAPGPRAQDCRQRIVDRLGLPETDNGVILVHGVSLRLEVLEAVTRLDTPPPSDRRHPASVIALFPLPVGAW